MQSLKNRLNGQNEPDVIIATPWVRGESNNDNANSFDMCEKALQSLKIDYKRVIGCYDGLVNRSFIIKPSPMMRDCLVRLFLSVYGQESVLVRSSNNIYLQSNEQIRWVGSRLVAVDRRVAKKLGAYTLVDGVYFIVE